MKELTIEEKAKAYDEAIAKSVEFLALCKKCGAKDTVDFLENIFPKLKESEDEQNILFEELKALHLRMEHQTVCNDAGGNRMWRMAWQHINEAINIIKEDKETYKW